MSRLSGQPNRSVGCRPATQGCVSGAAREFGLENVAVLDGGLGKWKREGRPLSQAPAPERSAVFEAKRQHRYFVEKGEVLALLADPRARIVSALPVQSHRVGFRRPGWIPGSIVFPPSTSRTR